MMKFSFLKESKKDRYTREIQELKNRLEKIEGDKAKREFLLNYAIGGKGK